MLVCREKSSATLTSAVKIENRGLAHSLTFSNVTQSGGKFEGFVRKVSEVERHGGDGVVEVLAARSQNV